MANGHLEIKCMWLILMLFTGPDRLFTFDYVYPWSSSQEDIFQSSFQPFLPTLLDGYNVSGTQ